MYGFLYIKRALRDLAKLWIWRPCSSEVEVMGRSAAHTTRHDTSGRRFILVLLLSLLTKIGSNKIPLELEVTLINTSVLKKLYFSTDIYISTRQTLKC